MNDKNVEELLVILQPIFGDSRMAEQETLTINLSQICQLKKDVILTKELPIKGSLLVVVPMLTKVPVQHITAIVITYQQMYAARMLLLDFHQFLQWGKDSLFMKLITRIWIKIITKAYNLSTLINCLP